MKAENERLVQKPAGGQRGGEKRGAVLRIHAAFLRRLTRAPALTTGFSMTGRQLRARLVRLFDTRPKRRGALLLALLCAAAVSVCGLVACGGPAVSEPDAGSTVSDAVSDAAVRAVPVSRAITCRGGGGLAGRLSGILFK